ncbi:MAG: helix-turn-helix domain-containing protein [Pyrinomonadaceae bacterium]
MVPGKPKRLTDEQLAHAQRLVDDGYRLKDVAARFGVTASQLNRYGVRWPSREGEEPAARGAGERG